MKVSKVIFVYLGFSIVYFIVANLLFDSDIKKGQNLFIRFLKSLGNALYWVQVFFYFLLALFVSSGIGMYYTKENRPVFLTFKIILISSLSLFLLAVITSYF